METSVITHYRRSARLLAGEVVGTVEPCPPATEESRAPVTNFLLAGVLAMLLVGVASGAWAAPIPGLFNTGTDAAGNALVGGNGVADPHYTVLSSDIPGVTTGVSAVTYFVPSAYAPEDTDSRWISHSSTGSPGSGSTVFRLSFDLTGLDPETAVINGVFAADNAALIFLNGTSTGLTVPQFNFLVPFSITDGFVAGVNTLDFRVTDEFPPMAFRVDDLVGTADLLDGGPAPVPAPASLALLGLGAAALGLRRRAAA
jgi:hypothetical protein